MAKINVAYIPLIIQQCFQTTRDTKENYCQYHLGIGPF